MKCIYTLLFVWLVGGHCWSQSNKDSLLLEHLRNVPSEIETDLQKLTNYLIEPVQNDAEKIRSIYLWIIHNISYDQKAQLNNRINRNNQDILNRKKAICWGYDTLLKAMGEIAGLSVEIISGYVKTTLDASPFLSYPTHAWNAVQLGDQWYLVDATWDSNLLNTTSEFYQKFQQDYYLSDPSYFISNHLPANPQWQLLDCPIPLTTFELPADSIVALAKRKDCIVQKTPKNAYNTLNYYDKLLLTGISTYQFNPTKENKRELGHIQIEYQEYLSDIATRLQINEQLDSLLLVHYQMIELCEVAKDLTDLYDTQLENCAYNYFNYAVALSQVPLTDENEQQMLKLMLVNFNKAANQLKGLKQNIFTEQAIQQAEEYIAYLEGRL